MMMRMMMMSAAGMSAVTFLLLLHLLVACSLSEVRQDLSQLRDHDVVGGQSRLSLRDKRTEDKDVNIKIKTLT